MEAASACVDKDRVTIGKFAIANKKNKIDILETNGKNISTASPTGMTDATAATGNEFSGTFCIWEEDHTLGNALRHVIMKK